VQIHTYRVVVGTKDPSSARRADARLVNRGEGCYHAATRSGLLPAGPLSEPRSSSGAQGSPPCAGLAATASAWVIHVTSNSADRLRDLCAGCQRGPRM
jgi:hypothetical protein